LTNRVAVNAGWLAAFDVGRVVSREQFTEKDGFVIKSLLSIPIYDGEKMVIGVIQMMNKLNGKPFAENDRNSLEVRKRQM